LLSLWRFCEELADDVFDLGFGDVEIGDWETAEGFAADFGDAGAGHFQTGGLGLLLDDFTEGSEVPRGGVGEGQADELVGGEAGDDFCERAVEEDFAMIDDDHAWAERLDVAHVVAGEDGGDLLIAIVVAEEIADALLRRDVEADGGLVEEENFGRVEERGDELEFHPLAEAQLADHDVHFVDDIEQLGERSDDFPVVLGIEAVDGPVELKGFAGGEVPPERVLLSHEQREFALEGILAMPRDVAEDGGFAAGGMQKAAEHLEHRGFAGAVGTEEADEFAFFDGEGDVICGAHFLILAPEQTADSAPEAGLLFIGAKDLGEAIGGDRGHRRALGEDGESGEAKVEVIGRGMCSGASIEWNLGKQCEWEGGRYERPSTSDFQHPTSNIQRKYAPSAG
jgi:hypothetical protein